MAHQPRLEKSERQRHLRSLVNEDPLLTDEMLAKRLQVSVQTVRLDRMELGLPEMRVRAKQLIETMQSRVRALALTEVVGELVDVELGSSGISILEATREMGFKRSAIVRGHYLFAQANSLAIAVTDAEMAVTGSARLRFHTPVRVGDRVVAKADVKQKRGHKSLVVVDSQVDSKLVFTARFVIFSLDHEQGVLKEGNRV